MRKLSTGHPNSQLVTATARATLCGTGVLKSLGMARAHDL